MKELIKSGNHSSQKLFSLTVFIFIWLLSINVHAQNRTVKGTVIGSEDGQPIPGVNIQIEGTEMGSSTDFYGFYSIEVPDDTTLVFTYIGMMETKVLAAVE